MTNEPQRLGLWSLSLTFALLTAAGPAPAGPPPERLAAREAARQAFLAAGYHSPSVVVDGSPRLLPGEERSTASPPLSLSRQGDFTPPRLRDVTSLTTITGEAGMAVPLGGDDVVVSTLPTSSGSAYLQITADGRCFGAVVVSGQVRVYRSTDHGETWTLWSTFIEPAGSVSQIIEFIVAEGATNRAMFAYRSNNEVRLAYADINAPVPSWVIVTVLSGAGVAHGSNSRIDIATDVALYSSYFVYVVAQSDDVDGTDIWFTRSLDMGTTFEPGYRIASAPAAPYDQRLSPTIDFGFDDYLHVAYASQDATAAPAQDTHYRRVPFWGDGGAAAWEPEQTLAAHVPGGYAFPFRIGASTTSGHVYVTLFRTTTLLPQLLFSTDSGATWPAANQVFSGVPLGSGMAPVSVPGGGLIMSGTYFTMEGGQQFVDVFVSRSTVADPTVWSAPESFSHHPWFDVTYSLVDGMVTDPSLGNRIAVLWVERDPAGDRLRFDAELRRDPGYPNTDVGFPILIAGGGQTPPAVAEVDGDAELEIVFGTVSGNIHVVNHDGSTVPGWPVNIGSVPFDTPVAVGDLVGNGVPSIVAGNTSGAVYAFGPDGSLLPGWPVVMTESADVHVSIGALGPPNARYVVAACGHELRALRYDGSDASPAWGTFTDVLTSPAAIGDVDNDGVTEIVTLKGHWFHVHSLGAGSSEAFRNFTETFSDAPTLADIDSDGDLEIAAPTTSGKLYLLNHDGSDYSINWPITAGPGILTGVAFGQILGTSEPELVFAERSTGLVHVRYHTGVEQTGYPQAANGPVFTPPMLSPVNITNSNVNVGVSFLSDHTAYSWRNIPANAVPGWPRNLPGPVEETFASGDIDLDGRNEIVVLGVDYLTVLDVGVAPASNPRGHWPMYGYDAQRTGCLACEEILTGVDDTPLPQSITALDAHPNPFNPTTTIEYEIARAGKVSLEIFDVAGRRVATLIDGEHRPTGRYSLTYNATGASGVYFARLRTAGGDVTRKIVLLK